MFRQWQRQPVSAEAGGAKPDGGDTDRFSILGWTQATGSLNASRVLPEFATSVANGHTKTLVQIPVLVRRRQTGPGVASNRG